MEYPAAISGTEKELKEDFRKAWGPLSSYWMKEMNAARKDKRSTDQLKVFKCFIDQYAMQHPLFCQLLQIMIATPPNTSPVERGYTNLEMVAAKRRNHMSSENLETLFLLSTLKVPVRGPDDYKKEIELLQK